MKTYIICLPQVSSSYQSALEVQKSLFDVGMEAELFEGTYGTTAQVIYKQKNRECHPWGLKGPERPLTQEQRAEMGSPGVIGCFDSHYRLWQHCVDINEPIMIFEDDVIIYRPYNEVEWEDVLSIAFSHAKKMARYKQYLDTPEGRPVAVHYGQSSMPGNGGYAIHPHAAAKLVNEYKNSFLPADNAINQYLVKIQLHSYMVGRARTKHEGNISLIRTSHWDDLPREYND